MDLGLERAGWTCRWQVEIDPFCQRVLAQHWPEVARYGDIKTLDLERLEHVDLLCGGFPCQPVSVAGKRLAQADARWLWPEFSRVVRALRPRLVLVENVPGLLGRGFGDVVGDLAASGYDAEWDCIPASAVGAPHRRDRVWLLAYANGNEWSADSRESDTGSNRRNDALRGVAPRTFPHADRHRTMGDDGDRHNSKWHPAAPLQERRYVLAGTLGSTWWTCEPSVARLVDGLSDGLDRHREAYGNAVVPQVAEWIGRRLMAAMRCAPA